MYVNVYLFAVREDDKQEYIRKAQVFAEVAKELGALEIFENWEKEVPDGEVTDYRRALQIRPGEKVVVSWVIWPDRRAGAAAHKAIFEDQRMKELGAMPVDGKRMILGGFEPVLSYRRDA